MIFKFNKLFIVSALVSSSTVIANDASNIAFEQVCGTQSGATYIQVESGTAVSVIPNAGNMYQVQTEAKELDTRHFVDRLASQFALERECAEYLVNNGQFISGQYGDLLASVYFDFDRANLTPVSKQILDRIIEIADSPSNEFVLTGHTDSTGPQEYNFQLGLKRAGSVQAYLSELGLDNTQIDSKGETEPKASNTTSQGREQNRRVEVTL
ncbi:OmpA family protein [Vibrio tubiashii]|uniref:Flagellar motor protein MotB n=1 Tax=Vibrio tubiashii ATCC 19109 TaxID=1051646 RepID=F9T9U4_9VIBR|nr:OmpA family protein [Vibrio tubiashii]AIW13787.1 flagellar motor protein MotB [Vibrio tubiashii ATCC 19109]EGU50854.1 OmpA/MotB domain-containing protein [Vibrio tubiashii ATCC 19109]EIF05226.1 OmpA/MotB domain-containing protein [Vibrio tubiashii NCIMB 1337 = ATCC 19106]